MCSKPINTDLDHLELFSWDRTERINALEGSLCYFNEGASPIVYLFIYSEAPTSGSKWF